MSKEAYILDKHKVIGDWILTTHETIFVLQTWLGLLQMWRALDHTEPDDFADACRQLKEARLWDWANEAGGHSIAALAEAIDVPVDFQITGRSHRTTRHSCNPDHQS